VTLNVAPPHARLLAALRRAKKPRFVVIGAVALDHHVPLARRTGDVDLAIVAEAEEILALLAKHGWMPDKRKTQRWTDAGGEKIDVLPASPRLLKAGSVEFDGESSMSLVGFDLALEHAEAVPVPGTDVEVEVASLAAIVVLKMTAWLDRPQQRLRDLGDLAFVFERVLADFDERRWEEPLSDVQADQQGAFFVGMLVGTIAKAPHRKNVDAFLREVSRDPWPAVMAREGRYVGGDVEVMVKERLGAFARGLSAPP
jgi:predicted nucleotidyltransferase